MAKATERLDTTDEAKELDAIHREFYEDKNIVSQKIDEVKIMTPQGIMKTKFIRKTEYKNGVIKNRLVANHKEGRMVDTNVKGVKIEDPWIFDFRTEKEKEKWLKEKGK